MSQLEEDLIDQLSPDIPTPVRELVALKPRKFRFDLSWPEHMLACEVEGGIYSGGRHTRGAGFESDCVKNNLAILAGWRVLRVTSAMIKDGRAVQFIQLALRKGDDDGTTSSD